MEDTLRDMGKNYVECLKAVLILVLMEDTLRDSACVCNYAVVS